MMKKRKKSRALIQISLSVWIILTIFSCKVEHNDNVYSSEAWKKGRKLFYNECAPCHTPKIKDKLFSKYYPQIVDDKELNKKRFEQVLGDSIHAYKLAELSSLSEKDFEDLRLFVETPQDTSSIY